MPNFATAAAAETARTIPVMLHSRARSSRRGLAGARREVPVLWGTTGASEAELVAAREALADPRGPAQRVLDVVADRLLAELLG